MKRLLWFLVLTLALVALWTPTLVQKATAQEQLPEQSPFVTACQTAQALAALSHLNLEYCRRASELVEGNLADVTVRVKISGQGVFFVHVGLMKTEWSQIAIEVRPA